MKKIKIDRFQMVLLLIIIAYSIYVAIKNPAFIHIETVFDIIRVSYVDCPIWKLYNDSYNDFFRYR